VKFNLLDSSHLINFRKIRGLERRQLDGASQDLKEDIINILSGTVENETMLVRIWFTPVVLDQPTYFTREDTDLSNGYKLFFIFIVSKQRKARRY
jgi:hypothetical protein